eukprot:3264155-Prymnesium_polylepis.1
MVTWCRLSLSRVTALGERRGYVARAVRGRWPKTPEGDRFSAPEARPDRKGCGLRPFRLDSWRFGCPRGLTHVPGSIAVPSVVRKLRRQTRPARPWGRRRGQGCRGTV